MTVGRGKNFIFLFPFFFFLVGGPGKVEKEESRMWFGTNSI